MEKPCYVSPFVKTLTVETEGVLCYSQKFDIPLYGWEEGEEDLGGDGNQI